MAETIEKKIITTLARSQQHTSPTTNATKNVGFVMKQMKKPSVSTRGEWERRLMQKSTNANYRNMPDFSLQETRGEPAQGEGKLNCRGQKNISTIGDHFLQCQGEKNSTRKEALPSGNGYPPTGPALQPDAFHRGAVAAQLAAQLATGLPARRVAERRLRVRVGARG
jgi:hypothetical protein